MRWEYRGRFSPPLTSQRKSLVSDPGMHHGMCVMHMPWCMSGSLTRGAGENARDTVVACVTRNFTYLVRGPWWRHQMETFSALLALRAGNSSVTGEFPSQRPVTCSFDIFLDLRQNKRLSKQSWGWCLRRNRTNYDVTVMLPKNVEKTTHSSSLSARCGVSFVNSLSKQNLNIPPFVLCSISCYIRPQFIKNIHHRIPSIMIRRS